MRPKKNSTKRTRLPRRVYTIAENVARVLDTEGFDEVQDLILDIMCEMSSDTQVWFTHPDLLRPFLLACARLDNPTVSKRLSELSQACHFAPQPSVIADLRRRWRYGDGAEEEKEAPAGERPHMTFTMKGDAMSPEIEPGDKVMYREGDEPRPGDIAVAQTPAGQIVRRVYFTAAGTVTLEGPNGDPLAFRREAVEFLGVVCAVKRGGEWTRLRDCARETPRVDPDTEDRLAELRERLDKIDPDDITDSTARLKLEKQIFDLEHPAGGDWNDWSQWEGGDE